MLLDGFKRLRCAAKLHLGVVPIVAIGADLNTTRHRSPHRTGIGVGRVPVPQQGEELVGFQRLLRRVPGLGPRFEAALRQAFLAKPKLLRVLDETFESATTIGWMKPSSAER